MPNTEIDLLQIKNTNNIHNNIIKLNVATLLFFFVWRVVIENIWKNYHGNYMNFYPAISHMVFFVIMIFYTVYISHKLNLRVFMYSILAILSMLVYLNGVNRRIPVVDILVGLIYSNLGNIGEAIGYYYLYLKEFIGNSFYEALLTWVIIDVLVQMWENKVNKEWETSVKYVYHSISNQIAFFSSINNNLGTIQIHNNQVHSSKIESFCKKRIEYYSRKPLFCKLDSSLAEYYIQTKAQYEHLLSLLNKIQSNPDHLNGHEYLKLLYETEAIFKRSKIIIDNG